jgi:hypothetical protein
MLNVVMLSVVMPNVVAPHKTIVFFRRFFQEYLMPTNRDDATEVKTDHDDDDDDGGGELDLVSISSIFLRHC